ncbi:MAG TPA: permease prefix domain 1-containing protein [Pirellulaceae bacterium]|nr:permease prefix domain 1-containing protein [Pirellulaceae bacterium]
MSQQEFDNYLALLARLLRIAPQQREQVAEEFRTHLEDRLDDLLARGMSRDKAVKLALEEFGDAAGLAANLAQISTIRKRRWYMKVSAFSVAGLAAAVLLAIALWPESQRLPATPQAIAQQPATKGAKGRSKAAPQPTLEEKLAARITVDFLDMPLVDVFEFVGAGNKIQIYVNRRALADEALELDAPITMSLKDVKVETVLDLALEQVSDQLAYLERDGVLIISTVTALEGATEVQVYNCRDLLALTTPQPGMMMGMEGGMMPGMRMPGLGGMGGMHIVSPLEQRFGFDVINRARNMLNWHDRNSDEFIDSQEWKETNWRTTVPPEEFDLDKDNRISKEELCIRIDKYLKDRKSIPPALPGADSPGGSSPPESRPRDAGSDSAVPAPEPKLPAPGEGSDPPAVPPIEDNSSIELWKDRAILAQMGGAMGGMMGGPGMMPGGGGMGGRSRPQPTTDHERKAARLMDLIITAVEPNSWQDTGGFGTISEYEGLIVVNHNARTHKKIENVLSMLRQAAGMPEGHAMPGMGGMMDGMMGSGMGGSGSGPAFGRGAVPRGPDAGGGEPGADPFGGGTPSPRRSP